MGSICSVVASTIFVFFARIVLAGQLQDYGGILSRGARWVTITCMREIDTICQIICTTMLTYVFLVCRCPNSEWCAACRRDFRSSDQLQKHAHATLVCDLAWKRIDRDEAWSASATAASLAPSGPRRGHS